MWALHKPTGFTCLWLSEVPLSSLQPLLDRRRLWRARDSQFESRSGIATGWRMLDAVLPGYGWQAGTLSELLCAQPELAMRLLQPALVKLSRQQRLIVWVGMPWLPYAPAWQRAGLELSRFLIVSAQNKQAQWAAEQALRLAKGSVLVSLFNRLDLQHSRRLQLAADAGGSYAFLLRPLSALNECNAAQLRLQLDAHAQGLRVTVHKRRGAFALPPFVLEKSSRSVRWPMRPILPATEKSEAFSQDWYQPDAVIGWRDQPLNGLWQ